MCSCLFASETSGPLTKYKYASFAQKITHTVPEFIPTKMLLFREILISARIAFFNKNATILFPEFITCMQTVIAHLKCEPTQLHNNAFCNNKYTNVNVSNKI